jgi:DNA-directed RNA polymerase specialized sigma24 family protein
MLRRAEPPRNPEAFLRTSIVNRAISQTRHRSRWSVRRPTIVGRQAPHSDVYPSDTDLLDRLDPRARVIVWLLDVERWTSPEVAEMLGMREAAVRQQAARARRRLRTHLETEDTP